MPFCNEEMGLLNAIHADPKNDILRRVYADWLEDQGEPDHAEFIRLQCQQPYIAIMTRDPRRPSKSFNYDFPRSDPTAQARLERLCALFPSIYGSPRYESLRSTYYYSEHVYGLPLLQIGSEDYTPEADFILSEIGPLARVDLWLHTANLADWLAHPVMLRVDKLHIWPDLDESADLDFDATRNSQYDAFWTENIRVLAASPIIDRLYEVRPCGCASTGSTTERSARNIALCQEMLEPRVKVEYSW